MTFKLRPPKASNLISTFLPGFMFASCVYLKLAITHKSLLTIAINGVPGGTRCQNSTDLWPICPAGAVLFV
ncbi:hypothetical protein QUA47_08385 [Microcoleus sp. MON2_D5]